MGRTKKWVPGEFETKKINIPKEKIAPYKEILKIKKKTIQDDILDHVDQVISQ